VAVDGVCESSVPPVLVEVWAHQGLPRPAQKAKVMTDALKLVWIERCLFPAGARKVLAFADDTAADHFRRQTWMSSALHDLGIEVIVVPLPDDLRSQITTAQTRQFR
jgi:acyl carrier protein phosphodiesterase